jgi:hypothetical protein
MFCFYHSPAKNSLCPTFAIACPEKCGKGFIVFEFSTHLISVIFLVVKNDWQLAPRHRRGAGGVRPN